jgi:predicted metal-dependent hydrolase
LAHEHWESVWLTLEEPQKSFLQALIQVTAAFHHRETGNAAGTISLLRRALRRLELCPKHFAGIAVPPLCQQISAWLRALEVGSQSLPEAPPEIRPTDPRTLAGA